MNCKFLSRIILLYLCVASGIYSSISWGDEFTYSNLSGSTNIETYTDQDIITLNNTADTIFTGTFVGNPDSIPSFPKTFNINAGSNILTIEMQRKDNTIGSSSTNILATGIVSQLRYGTAAPYNVSININTGTLRLQTGGSDSSEYLNVAIAENAKLEIVNSSAKKMLHGSISGAGKVLVKGYSELTNKVVDFYPGNTYSGGTEISDNAFVRAVGTGIKTYFGSGEIHIHGGGIGNGIAKPTVSNNIVIGTTEGADDNWAVFRAGNSGNTFTSTGVVSGSGKLYIARDNGTVILDGANTYSGGTEIGTSPMDYKTDYGSTVIVQHPNALGTGPVNFNYEHDTTPTTLDIKGMALQIGGLSSLQYGSTVTYLAKVYLFDSAETPGSLNINAAVKEGTEAIYTGQFADPDGNNPIKEIIKSGDGIQTFANTFPSETKLVIKKGIVKLSSQGTTVGNMESKPTVDSGGILLTDYLYAGVGTDYIDIAGANFSNGGTFQVDIADLASFSRFDLTAAIEDSDYNPAKGFLHPNLIDVETYSPEVGDYFNLSYNAAQFNDSLTDVNLESWLSVADRASWDLNWYVNDAVFGQKTLVLQYKGVLIPEPSTWVLLILGAAGLMYFRRKSMKQ